MICAKCVKAQMFTAEIQSSGPIDKSQAVLSLLLLGVASSTGEGMAMTGLGRDLGTRRMVPQ